MSVTDCCDSSLDFVKEVSCLWRKSNDTGDARAMGACEWRDSRDRCDQDLREMHVGSCEVELKIRIMIV